MTVSSFRVYMVIISSTYSNQACQRNTKSQDKSGAFKKALVPMFPKQSTMAKGVKTWYWVS